MLFAVNINSGEIAHIFVNTNKLLFLTRSDVVHQVVSASRRIVVHRASDINIFSLVYKAIERTVATTNNNTVAIGNIREKADSA